MSPIYCSSKYKAR